MPLRRACCAELLANTSAALVLVLVVVAVGVAGDRVAGVLAALSAAAAFDYFLTVPYYQFAILDRDDVETAVLLLAIGIAVTEISLWGKRQQSLSSRREGYLTGVAHAARMAADGSSTEDLIATVERMITDVLDLDDTRYVTPAGTGRIRTGPSSIATGRCAGAGTSSTSPAKACRRWTSSSSKRGATATAAGSC